MLSLALAPALFLLSGALGRETSNLERNVLAPNASAHSLNVSSCPGYTLGSVKETKTGLTAALSLAGPACNAFGQDIANLTIDVTYETTSRLHVKIYDTDQQQFSVPESVVSLPAAPTSSLANSSDLVFNHDASPFAFWITRRSDPDAAPLFDTRIASLPATPIPPVDASVNRTALDGFPLVFEDQYLQLTSALPKDANVYGLGEVIASSGFRRDVSQNGSIQTLWARDVGDPIDANEYGSHPIYLEHRFNSTTNTSQSHGVFILSSAGADILLLTPPNSNVSLVEYRMIGGILDFYFFSGPDPKSVTEQYGALIGLPTWQPAWAFGFHLCRWGYSTVNETQAQVDAMRAANIPLEVMWNDIDLYHAYRDFTSDPVSFPGDEMRAFIQNLTAHNQHYVPIVDAAVAKAVNSTDIYDPYTRGTEQKVFINNPDGSEYVGQVWPGYTVFPDWFANNTQKWWTEALTNWSKGGVEFAGIWLDMNEASSFCDGSCGSTADISNTSTPFLLPGTPGNMVTAYPECYNVNASGPTGNMTVNGTSTSACGSDGSASVKRGLGAANDSDANLNAPPYAINNGFGELSFNTLATNATHAPGYVELDVHNMWGLMEEKATHLAVQEILPGKRPFLISRSTFPSSGKWTGHWLGDNYSKWQYLALSIQGVLQFQLFQIPFVGADTCGFNGNTDEELCNRWMQLSAFTPFYRNHNTKGALSQEPYRWDSVANASRTAIGVRYSLLPYWYTLFANSSTLGTPPVRALFFEFPNEPELFSIDKQFLIGSDILVTPVVTPNVTTVDGMLPGRGSVTWRDWYTHDVVNSTADGQVTFPAPLGHINAHIRDSSAILTHAKPAYTIEETRQGPYSLLVSQASDGHAFGTAYIDDGVSNPPGPSKTLSFSVTTGQVKIAAKGAYDVKQKLQDITILGTKSPTEVKVGGKSLSKDGWEYIEAQEKLVVKNVNLDLNDDTTVSWK
ncbi:glycoside hydrolase family 31 protein [Plicaturopsis crispa FD-325 SS-3]|uniref:Glycoside hydrolase family 31 protein n=1 Tax=Plicaturopsis crispa FD-325 SS-3 TaxID=944288 RepID=A0A0C9T743_PLICR|nr:glycoside hydrolase family 31 protein [Plicaturopsis crispa FD-325 SS-3]